MRARRCTSEGKALTSCPSQTWDGDIPHTLQSQVQGLPAARSYEQRMAPRTAKIFSAHQLSLLLCLPTHYPGISSHAPHCHLPNLIWSLALCCHLHDEELAKESSLLSVVSQEAPHSLTSLLNLPPHLPESCSFSLFSVNS